MDSTNNDKLAAIIIGAVSATLFVITYLTQEHGWSIFGAALALISIGILLSKGSLKENDSNLDSLDAYKSPFTSPKNSGMTGNVHHRDFHGLGRH